jgi:hypothetical protein
MTSDTSNDTHFEIEVPQVIKSGTASPWAAFDAWGAGGDIFSNLDENGTFINSIQRAVEDVGGGWRLKQTMTDQQTDQANWRVS